MLEGIFDIMVFIFDNMMFINNTDLFIIHGLLNIVSTYMYSMPVYLCFFLLQIFVGSIWVCSQVRFKSMTSGRVSGFFVD